MISPENIILLKSVFWYLNKRPDTAFVSDQPVEKVMDTTLSTSITRFWIPVAPADGESQTLNVLEVKFPATPSDPLTLRKFLYFLYKHYNLTTVKQSPDTRYIDLMKDNILFAGVQYLEKHGVYNVTFLQTSLFS
jgi:hypothetical protein